MERGTGEECSRGFVSVSASVMISLGSLGSYRNLIHVHFNGPHSDSSQNTRSDSLQYIFKSACSSLSVLLSGINYVSSTCDVDAGVR